MVAIDYFYLPTYLPTYIMGDKKKAIAKEKENGKIKKEKALSTAHDSLMKT